MHEEVKVLTLDSDEQQLMVRSLYELRNSQLEKDGPVEPVEDLLETRAAQQFQATKKLHKKTDGRLCFHGYQSFRHGEVDAATAHEIGKELVKRMWGDEFEVVIATHCNTGCYHNHFVVNSVSRKDGHHFHNAPADYRRLREISDQICREHGLSVIENPRGHGRNYAEYEAEKNGKPTNRGMIRADIDRAIAASVTRY